MEPLAEPEKLKADGSVPICRHREYVKGRIGLILCHSPDFASSPNRTNIDFCKESCRYVDRDCGNPPRVENRSSGEKMECVNLGEYTGETEHCQSCRGTVLVKVYACSVYGRCTMGKPVNGLACCNGTRGEDGFHTPCPSYRAEGEHEKAVPITQSPSVSSGIRWSYALTTTPLRMENGLLDRTIASLESAGFPSPRLHIDGGEDQPGYRHVYPGHQITCHQPALKTHGNWVLSLYETYIRNPHCDRYAVFQDDFVTYPRLREYLDSCPYPEKGYWNLYTFPQNQKKCPPNYTGWYPSNQRGLGAVALVFDRKAVMTLLSSPSIVERVQHPRRGHKAIDGGIVHAMKKAGYKEYVHNPSLVQHTGEKSSMGNKKQPLATSFRGEDFDARELIHTPQTQMV